MSDLSANGLDVKGSTARTTSKKKYLTLV